MTTTLSAEQCAEWLGRIGREYKNLADQMSDEPIAKSAHQRTASLADAAVAHLRRLAEVEEKLRNVNGWMNAIVSQAGGRIAINLQANPNKHVMFDPATDLLVLVDDEPPLAAAHSSGSAPG